MSDPYEAPKADSAPPSKGMQPVRSDGPVPRPDCVDHFKIFAYCCAVFYLAVVGFYAYVSWTIAESYSGGATPATYMIYAGLVLFFVTVLGYFLLADYHGKWAYGIHIALLALGLLGACTIIPAVFLLMKYVDPEVRRWFSQQVETS